MNAVTANNGKRKHDESYSSYAMNDTNYHMARPFQRRRFQRHAPRKTLHLISRKRSYQECFCEEEKEWTKAPTRRSRHTLTGTSVSRPIDQDDLCERMGNMTLDKSFNDRVNDICQGMGALTLEKTINERLDDICKGMGALTL